MVFFWSALFILSLAFQYAAATAPQKALALSGAIYSSNFDGSITNANHYATKPDVYLTGGPCQGGSHLPQGDYYFEVSIPNTATLLSTDAIGNRMFHVGANGFIASTGGTHGTHAVACTGVTGLTIQLIPFKDTTNPGGEYKLTVATAASVEACEGFSADAVMSICGGADQKSDNFKVLGPGSLKITKAVDGAPNGFSGSFPITIDCGVAGTFHETIAYPVPASVTIPKVDAGAVCTVSEGDLPTPPIDYAWGDPTFTGNPATIDSGGNVTVAITNHMHFVPKPALTIVKSVSLGADGPWVDQLTTTTGTTVHYRITVTNTGNVALTDVSLSDSIFTLEECTVPSTLAIGASFDCNYSSSATTGTVTNTATADSAQTVPASDSATVIASVTPPPPTLTIDKSNDAPLVTVGDAQLPTAVEGSTVTFTLHYSFSGESVSGATITDVLPDGLTYVTGSATNGGDFTFVGYTAGTHTLTWTASEVTESASVSYKATVDTGAAGLVQPLVNVAAIESEQTDKDNASSEVFVTTAVKAETSAPSAPPTDVVASSETSGPGVSLTLILLALAGLALVISLITPTPARFRDRTRRQ